MNYLVVDYFNCENGLLILKRGFFDNNKDYDNAKKTFDELVSYLISSVKITYFKGENGKDYALYISEEDREMLKSLLDLPITDEKNRNYHLNYVTIHAMQYAAWNGDLDHAFNLLRCGKDVMIRNKKLHRELHDILEEYTTSESNLVRFREMNEDEKNYVDFVRNNFSNEVDYILPSKTYQLKK